MPKEELRTVPWYDRNPVLRQLLYSPAGGVAPHAEAERDKYTVPDGKMALITSAFANIKRATAATAAGALVYAYIDIAVEGPPDESCRLLNVFFHEKDIDVGDKLCMGQCALLKAGQYINICTADASADGTVAYRISCSIIEFDAWPIEEEPFRRELPERDIQEPDSVVKGQM